jgi:hypothetical protein
VTWMAPRTVRICASPPRRPTDGSDRGGGGKGLHHALLCEMAEDWTCHISTIPAAPVTPPPRR